MAITLTAENLESGDIRSIKWAGATTGDAGAPIEFTQWADVCVHALGTFGGATITVQGSNDGSDWQTLNTAQGTAATFTAAGIKQIVERPRYIRPSVTGGTGVSVTIIAVLRRAQPLRV